MSRTLQTTLGVAFGLFFCFIVAAFLLFVFTAEGGCGCVLATGRDVALQSTGWSCSMCNTHDTAMIDAAGHKIVVAPRFIDVDGRRIATIDANTKSIEVGASRGEITFVGDGQQLAKWRR